MRDGGPAFPQPLYDAEGYESNLIRGMTLRDYFAAHLAAAELASAGANEDAARALADAAAQHGMTIECRMAHNAYAIADAMLAERKK